MEKFGETINLNQIFSKSVELDGARNATSLSHYCEDDVREGKWFLCYC